MVKNLPRRQEQQGTRRVFIWGIIAAVVIAIGFTVGPWLNSVENTHPQAGNTGQLSSQEKGVSVAGKTTAPPPHAGTNAAPESVGRAEAIQGTAKNTTGLRPQQVDAIKDYVANHPQQKASGADFAITIGSAVPNDMKLYNVPQQLALHLPSYKADQFFIVPNEFVIVEKQTRRIIAIVPVAT